MKSTTQLDLIADQEGDKYCQFKEENIHSFITQLLNALNLTPEPAKVFYDQMKQLKSIRKILWCRWQQDCPLIDTDGSIYTDEEISLIIVSIDELLASQTKYKL